MRLLQFGPSAESERLEIRLCEYQVDVPPYAIFSHRWGSAEDEVSFRDLMERRGDARLKKGYQKIESCCRQALKDNLTHAWVDTCCIDKTSSAELSEAINSMYKWYTDSRVCYAYLSDVKSNEDIRGSNWFTRAWTLQELIAPREVVFFSSDWTEIGEKRHMAKLIHEITDISEEVTIHRNIEDVCISQKMCWASRRQSTRIEDRAYSLLGLFNISLPILYGEGLRAFTRLQERIVQTSVDHTIFAWDLSASDPSGLLADSPDAFANSSRIQKMPAEDYMEKFNLSSPRIDYALTNHGLEIFLPHLELYNYVSLYAAFLACYYEDSGKPVVLYFRRSLHHRLSNFFFRTKLSSHSLSDENRLQSYDIGKIALDKLLITTPERPWARALRPLLPEEIAKPSKVLNELDIKGYNVRLLSSGTVLAVYPMPHKLDKTDLTVDTDSGTVWVTSLLFHENYEVKVIFAVVDNELTSHLALTNDLKTHSTLEAFLSCEAYHDRDELFPNKLCKHVKLQIEDSETNGDEDMIVKALDPQVSYINIPRRKVFTIRVDLKSESEWEGPKHNSSNLVVQEENGEVAEWRAYVKAMADAPHDDMIQVGFDSVWQNWQQHDKLPKDFAGRDGPKKSKVHLSYLWECSLKSEFLYVNESVITEYGKLWRQLGHLRYGDILDDGAAQRKVENSKILVEHMRTTASDAPDSEAVKRVYEEMWGMWKHTNVMYSVEASDVVAEEKEIHLKSFMKRIRKLYSKRFDKKEIDRFRDFWRLLMETRDASDDTFGEGFTPEFRQNCITLGPQIMSQTQAIGDVAGTFGPSLPPKLL